MALATVLLLLAVGILGTTGVAAAQASTVYVDGGTDDPDCGDGDEYGSIQNAVDNATAGDTVVVCDGTYDENVTIDEQLTLRADAEGTVTLVGETLQSGATAITVGSGADGTVVDGFAVTGFGEVTNVSAGDTVVRDLVANDSDTGVVVSASGAATVSNVTVRNVTLDNTTTGVRLSASGDGELSDVNVFRNLVNGSATGVSVDGGSSVPLEAVGIRQNLVANASSAGVRTTSGTDTTGVRVTRNFFQDNDPYAVENADTSTNLTAWLNHWGDDSGPGSVDPANPVADPETGTLADGDGDNVSENVRFDPWLGKGACVDPQLANVTDRTVTIFEEEVGLSGLQPTCVWDRAALPLRADDDDAATSVRNLNVILRTDRGDVPANRQRLSVYQRGKSFTLEYGPTTGADTSRFAGNETQLLVVRGDEAATNFEVGLDNSTGEGRLDVDAASVEVIDTSAIDAEGELNVSFEPASAGDYTFVLVTNDFGPGVSVGDSGTVRVDGGISVVGVESVPVQNANASGSTVDSSYPAGSNVTFQLDSNLDDATTNHSVLLYKEPTFTDQRVTVEVDGDLSAVLTGDLSSTEVTIERSIRSLNGFIRAEVGLSALGFEVESQSRSGRIDAGPFIDVALSEFGVEDVNDTVTSDAVVLNGSIVVVQSGDSDTDVDVETFGNFSTGTYRWVYVAQQGSEVSSDDGTVELTTPTPTPTPSPGPGVTPTAAPGGGGGGGGGQPGAGPGGEVEIEDAVLLNDTVEAGQPVVVRVNLSNFDPASGRITLNMTANGEVVTTRRPSVGASSRRTVFVRNRFPEAGTYTIGLNGEELGTVTVTAAPTETPVETPTPTRTPTPVADGTPTEPSEVTESPEGTPPVTGSPTPGQGPPAPTGTEFVITFALVLGLLAAVGVVVYVLPA